MGNCLGLDVNVGTKAGHTKETPFSSIRQAEQAVAAIYGSLGYSSWVQIHVSCKHLKDADTFSKSDPMVFFLNEAGPGAGWNEVGRTECIKNNLNPRFAKFIKTLYNFEAVQQFRVLAVDLDKGQNPDTVAAKDCDSLGEAVFTLSELLAAPGRTLTRAFQDPKTKNLLKSTFTLSAEELPNANELLEFQVEGKKLANKDTFSKSDPFLQISRAIGDGQERIPVLRTETKNNDLNPVWDPIKVTATQLCNGDWYQKLVFEVYDHNSSGKHVLIGSATTSVKDLQQLAGNGSCLNLIAPASSASQGTLQLSSFKSVPQPSFLDFLAGGMEINFVVAVDFTASNGHPSSPQSLHHINQQTGYTPYEHAILGVGQVVEFYDFDKLVPAFGFGGQRRGEVTQHCFPLNGNSNYPYNQGVAGVLQAYRKSLQEYGLSGPTLFAPIIQVVTALVAQPKAQLHYTCLLILTDGDINDMQETVDAVITATALPMSILIVGVGSSSFSNMIILDGDNQRLSQNGRTAERDIVQFVEFNKFSNNGVALAAELLRELPGQVTQFMQKHNVLPRPRPTVLPLAVAPA